jgi:ABC-type dipeptide/oligopeptide/nickel transport system permease component
MPQSINQIISSFMIVSVATGFYLARFFNQFMVIEQKESYIKNIIAKQISSLEIYSSGFLKLTIISLIFLIFWIILFSFKRFEKILEIE